VLSPPADTLPAPAEVAVVESGEALPVVKPVPPVILISAGEASGEMYAAQLARALQEKTGAHLFGLGGPHMREAGVEVIADSSQVAVVGISEVLGRLPAALRILKQLEQEAAKRKPKLAILVDFPDFNLRLGRKLKAQGISIVYFISPQVWAWRPRRVEVIKELVKRILVIFPFEEKIYRQARVPVDFVGHPLVDMVRPSLTRSQFAARYGLETRTFIVALLPGSRKGEIAHNLPRMLKACRRLAADLGPQFVLAAAPGLGKFLERYMREDLPVRIVEGVTYDALAAADCSIVSSGTATVEAALLGAPMVVVYRLSWLTARIARRLVQTSFYSMVNLIMNKKVVPELIQEGFKPETLEAEVRRLLNYAPAREQMKRDLKEVRARLGPGGAIERAAEIIARML
jgi:lipid-A-disaccharide synthase